EQGTYWVANNFIWGWLLLPINQLGELIKRDVGESEEAIRKNTLGYFMITLAVCALWFALIPLYKPFMTYVLNYGETEKLFGLVMVLIGFYVTYAFQNIFDCTFYGLGKTPIYARRINRDELHLLRRLVHPLQDGGVDAGFDEHRHHVRGGMRFRCGGLRHRLLDFAQEA
ncbi:MAG: hypothetical protein HUJ60_01850, partial [Bacilli bacterium]|nr:hypothetical protein [Bacilli bacterium]